MSELRGTNPLARRTVSISMNEWARGCLTADCFTNNTWCIVIYGELGTAPSSPTPLSVSAGLQCMSFQSISCFNGLAGGNDISYPADQPGTCHRNHLFCSYHAYVRYAVPFCRCFNYSARFRALYSTQRDKQECLQIDKSVNLTWIAENFRASNTAVTTLIFIRC